MEVRLAVRFLEAFSNSFMFFSVVSILSPAKYPNNPNIAPAERVAIKDAVN